MIDSKLSKAKIYINDVSEVPKGVAVKQGPKKGLYYEGGHSSKEAKDSTNADRTTEQTGQDEWAQVWRYPGGYNGKIKISIKGPGAKLLQSQWVEGKRNDTNFRTEASAKKWIRDNYRQLVKKQLTENINKYINSKYVVIK